MVSNARVFRGDRELISGVYNHISKNRVRTLTFEGDKLHVTDPGQWIFTFIKGEGDSYELDKIKVKRRPLPHGRKIK